METLTKSIINATFANIGPIGGFLALTIALSLTFIYLLITNHQKQIKGLAEFYQGQLKVIADSHNNQISLMIKDFQDLSKSQVEATIKLSEQLYKLTDRIDRKL